MLQTAPINTFKGEVSPDLNYLFLYGREWFAPNKAFRRLLGIYGEALVRTVICNSSREIDPSAISDEMCGLVAGVCEKAKAAAAQKKPQPQLEVAL